MRQLAADSPTLRTLHGLPMALALQKLLCGVLYETQDAFLLDSNKSAALLMPEFQQGVPIGSIRYTRFWTKRSESSLLD